MLNKMQISDSEMIDVMRQIITNQAKLLKDFNKDYGRYSKDSKIKTEAHARKLEDITTKLQKTGHSVTALAERVKVNDE